MSRTRRSCKAEAIFGVSAVAVTLVLVVAVWCFVQLNEGDDPDTERFRRDLARKVSEGLSYL